MHRNEKIKSLCCTAFLGITAFGSHYYFEYKLDCLKVVDKINILFDADVGWFLGSYAHGWGGTGSLGGRGLVHPNVANFVNPPVRILDRLMQILGDHRTDRMTSRRQVALLVAPLASAISTVLVYLTLRQLRVSWFGSFLTSLIFAFSYSSLVFGSVPESYPLSLAAIAALFYVSALALDRECEVVKWPWVLVGIFVIGFTVTNFVPFCLMFGYVTWVKDNNIRYVLVATSKIAASVLISTAIAYISVSYVGGPKSAFEFSVPKQTEEIHTPRWGYLMAFPLAVARSICPSAPSVLPIPETTPGATHDIRFSYRPSHQRNWQAFLMCGLLMVGLGSVHRAGQPETLAGFGCHGARL